MVEYSPRRRIYRVIVMNPTYRLAGIRPPGIPHIVIENEHTAGTQGFAQQALYFGVVDALDLVG
jgi:hypothetical protein